jgi:hypothetical protein
MKIKIADAEAKRHYLIKSFEMGPWRFLLWRGLIGWAIPMFVFFTCFIFATRGDDSILTLDGLRRTAVICAVAGLIVGSLRWLLISRAARKLH